MDAVRGHDRLSPARAEYLRQAVAAARLRLGVALYAAGQKEEARREWQIVAALGEAGAAASARRLLARYPLHGIRPGGPGTMSTGGPSWK